MSLPVNLLDYSTIVIGSFSNTTLASGTAALPCDAVTYHTYIHTYSALQCLHVRTYTYIHTYIHTYIFLIEPVPWWILAHKSIHTYINTYIRIHTFIHTHIHTYILALTKLLMVLDQVEFAMTSWPSTSHLGPSSSSAEGRCYWGYTYIQYIHTYIHTYIYTYSTYIQYIHTYIHTYLSHHGF